MSSRSVVSYDDITLPYDPPEETATAPGPAFHNAERPSPPPKKRKKGGNQHNKSKNKTNQRQQKNASNSRRSEFLNHLNSLNHSTTIASKEWQAEVVGDAELEYEDEEGEYEEEESRELTHQEIWDDSALVDAWDAAIEEYHAFHGPDKDWKQEPVKKSLLWYNIPVDPSKKASSTNKATTVDIPAKLPEDVNTNADEQGDQENSKPIDFDTFVPTHDPSLESGVQAVTTADSPIPVADFNGMSGQIVSQDEAFQRAMSAMYWSGYWTAMYYAQRQLAQPRFNSSAVIQDPAITVFQREEEEGEEVEDTMDSQDEWGFVSTQR